MRRIVAPILAGVELAGTAFIATLLIAAPARAQEPAPYDPPPMLTIEARPFGAADGRLGEDVLNRRDPSILDIDWTESVPEQLMVVVRITSKQPLNLGTVRVTAVQDGADKGEAPVTLIDRTRPIGADTRSHETSYVNFGMARVRCQDVTFRAVMQVEYPAPITVTDEKRLRLSCNFHRP